MSGAPHIHVRERRIILDTPKQHAVSLCLDGQRAQRVQEQLLRTTLMPRRCNPESQKARDEQTAIQDSQHGWLPTQ
jgi:hypothetical protein